MASDRDCPKYVEEMKKLWAKIPTTKYRYFPSNDPRTWERFDQTDENSALENMQNAMWQIRVAPDKVENHHQPTQRHNKVAREWQNLKDTWGAPPSGMEFDETDHQQTQTPNGNTNEGARDSNTYQEGNWRERASGGTSGGQSIKRPGAQGNVGGPSRGRGAAIKTAGGSSRGGGGAKARGGSTSQARSKGPTDNGWNPSNPLPTYFSRSRSADSRRPTPTGNGAAIELPSWGDRPEGPEEVPPMLNGPLTQTQRSHPDSNEHPNSSNGS